MGIFGKLLAAPFKIVNAPLRAVEDFFEGEECDEDERVFSKPLDFLAKHIKEVDE